MDNQVLNLLADRLRKSHLGARLEEACAAREGVVLRLDAGPLFFSLRQELPLLMARPQGEAKHPDPAAAGLVLRLRARLSGAKLTAVEKEPSDRLVRLRFEGTGGEVSIIHYLPVPHRVELVLTDADLRTLAGSGYEKDEEYLPPPPPGGEVDFHTAEENELREALEKIGSDDSPADSARRVLRGADANLAAELAARLEEGVDSAVGFLFELRELRFEAALFSPAEDGDIALQLLPGCYRGESSEAPETFDDPNDAADIYYRRRMRAFAVAEVKTEIGTAVSRSMKRLRRLQKNLQADLRSSEEESEIGRRGDLILANIGSIRRGIASVEVEDIYKGDGSRITIELDPKLDPAANADRYYKRARKARRAQDSVSERIVEVGGELETLSEFEERCKLAGEGEGDLKVLRALRDEMVRHGWLTQRQKKERKIALPPGRRFLSSDGLEIIVGRNSRDNEVVTFKVGKENDFWMHAAGYSGSHVVIRNPRKLQEPPPATLAQAASIAAYYSKARQSSNVQVNWSLRRFVKKAKGGEPGAVLLTSYSSVIADPEIPAAVRTP